MLWGILLLATGCAGLRNVPEGQAFLNNHAVWVHNAPDEFKVSESELLALAKPTPNRKILGIRFNHTVYLLVNKKRLARSEELNKIRCERKNEKRVKKGKQPKECKTWRMFWAYTVGEPTRLIDSASVERSANQMNIFLQKRGYFRAKSQPEYIYSKSGKDGEIVYHVYPGKPYMVRGIKYIIEDEEMASMFPRIENQLSVKSGSVFNVDKLDADRERITSFFNNNGYYEFNKEFISFDADTSGSNFGVDLILLLQTMKQHVEGTASETLSIPHKKYFIGDIYVDSRFNPMDPDKVNPAPQLYNGLLIYNDSTSTVSRNLLSCVQGFSTGDLYNKSRIDRTYRRYSELGVFRSINILLVPRRDSLNPKINRLDTHLRLTPEKKQGFTIDPHMTNRSGNMGVYLNPGYLNKNLFRGAERLEARMVFGFEASQTLVQTTDGSGGVGQLKKSFILNTFEIGPELSVRIPRLWPFGCDFTSRSSDPRTMLTALYNYQRRPDYKRTLSQVRYGYNYIENPDKVTRVNLEIVDFSIIKIDKSDQFQQFLDRINDSFLASSYQNHLILALATPSITWNTQKKRFQRSYFYWKITAGGAGNTLNGIMQVLDAKRDEKDSYELAGIRFAQYFRGEQDFRYYINIDEKDALVWRLYGGVGVPRKNLNVLPFERSFFSGGSNGMRAWQARTLGPGSSRDTLAVQTFNNIGDIKLEGNFEYRFKITKMVNWALFMDAGNIWLLRPDATRPGGEFKADRFLSEIAINSGIGLRLDFDIFLVRFDLGIKLKDPAKIQGERWIGQPKNEYLSYLRRFDSDIRRVPMASNTVINLGIGFPF